MRLLAEKQEKIMFLNLIPYPPPKKKKDKKKKIKIKITTNSSNKNVQISNNRNNHNNNNGGATESCHHLSLLTTKRYFILIVFSQVFQKGNTSAMNQVSYTIYLYILFVQLSSIVLW